VKFSQHFWPIAALCLVFAAGFTAGRMGTSDASGLVPPVSAAMSLDSSQAGLAEASSPATGWPSLPAALTESGRGLRDKFGFTDQARLAQAYLASGGDTSKAVELMIEGMADRELIASIVATTNTSRADLDDIRDLRGYAKRLANIALDGVLTEGSPDPVGVPDVMFTSDIDPDGFPEEVNESFGTRSQRRIYAVFPSEDFVGDQVLVKWFREGESDLLLFGRYPIEPGKPLNHVWMERDGGWQSGPYVVEFFDPAEPLERLAMGRFVVSDDAGRDANL